SVTQALSVTASGDNKYVNLPCDATVGSGSGRISIDQSSVKDGEVICIKKGKYSIVSVKDISSSGKPVIIQNDGKVEIIERMVLSNLSNVVISGSGRNHTGNGIIIRDTNYRGAELTGKFNSFTMQN